MDSPDRGFTDGKPPLRERERHKIKYRPQSWSCGVRERKEALSSAPSPAPRVVPSISQLAELPLRPHQSQTLRILHGRINLGIFHSMMDVTALGATFDVYFQRPAIKDWQIMKTEIDTCVSDAAIDSMRGLQTCTLLLIWLKRGWTGRWCTDWFRGVVHTKKIPVHPQNKIRKILKK